MGIGVRDALMALALAAGAQRLAAQDRPPAAAPSPAAQDSAARASTVHDTSGLSRLIYSDVVTGGTAVAPRILLTKGLVYRIEVEPGSAAIEIRSARRPTLPPLFLVPLSPEALSTSYLVVPGSTQDYRLDVAATIDQPVRLRIWLDPKEAARYARIRVEGFKLPVLAFAVRAVVMAPFRDARSSPFDSYYSANTRPTSAAGVQVCLAVVPNGKVLPDRTGGCALTYGYWRKGTGGSFHMFGIEPEVVIARGRAGEVAVTPQLAFGGARDVGYNSDYVFLGLGTRYTGTLPRNPNMGFQVQATVLNIDSSPNSPDVSRVHSITLSLSAGLIVKL